MKKLSRLNQAFTIVELLIAIVIIGILVAIVIVGYGAVRNSANDASVKSDLTKIDDAFKQFSLDNQGVFPDTTAELATLGLKLSGGAYSTTTKANVYICTNPTSSEYAVIAMSKSGNRFMVKSEEGISQYGGSVVWNSTTGNWDPTCVSIDPTYDSPANLTGMADGIWQSWTGADNTFITNMITNPSFETGITNVGGNQATPSQTMAWSASGSAALQVSPTSGNDTNVQIGGDSGALRLGMQPGKTYTLSAVQNIPVSLTGTFDSFGRVARIVAYQKNAGVYTFDTAGGTTTAGVRSLSVTFTLGASATDAFIRLYNGTTPGGGVVYYDSVMLTEGSTSRVYADGGSPGWFWDGTAGSSSSHGPAL